ncbi:hypothetical protein [Halobacterium hubeiense]|uniref:hypothetical protein n=1 Tax=Halobacterium hubeiense TaxID=1407499 RepID=UPI003C73DC00
MVDSARASPGRTADRRDGLLALLFAQSTLLTVVVASATNTPSAFVIPAYAVALVVGLPAFVVGLALLAPDL